MDHSRLALKWVGVVVLAVACMLAGFRTRGFSEGGEQDGDAPQTPAEALKAAGLTPENATEVRVGSYRYTHPLSVRWMVEELARVHEKVSKHDHKYPGAVTVLGQEGAEVELPFWLRHSSGLSDFCCIGESRSKLTPLLTGFLSWAIETMWSAASPEQKKSDEWKTSAFTVNELRSAFSAFHQLDVDKERQLRFYVAALEDILHNSEPDAKLRERLLKTLVVNHVKLKDYATAEQYVRQYADLLRGADEPADWCPAITRERSAQFLTVNSMRISILRAKGEWERALELIEANAREMDRIWRITQNGATLTPRHRASTYFTIHGWYPRDRAACLEAVGRYAEALELCQEILRFWREPPPDLQPLLDQLPPDDPYREVGRDNLLAQVGKQAAQCRERMAAQPNAR